MCPGQAEEVFINMAGDFMKPVVDIVDQLLTAGVNVTVYNGQLDLIVDTMGNLLSDHFLFSSSSCSIWPRDQFYLDINPSRYWIPEEKSCTT